MTAQNFIKNNYILKTGIHALAVKRYHCMCRIAHNYSFSKSVPGITLYGSHASYGVSEKLFRQVRNQFPYIWEFLLKIFVYFFGSSKCFKAIVRVFIRKK